MQLISKEIISSHLQRAEGAAEVTLPIDFFRDLLYQAMPQQRKPLTDEQIERIWHNSNPTNFEARSFARAIEAVHGIKE